MTRQIRVLCVHGVGDHHSDLSWQDRWRSAIERGAGSQLPGRKAQIEFAVYDDLFDLSPLGPGQVLAAMAKLLASGLRFGLADKLARGRGITGLPARVRWTAGMVVQWAEDDQLRRRLRQRVLAAVQEHQPGLVLAHSLGSLICYDTFVRQPGRDALRSKDFVSFGSQIGNTFVRSVLGGRIVPLSARRWLHLYNRHDDALTSPLQVQAPGFEQVPADFDLQGFGDHDAVAYLTHDNVIDRVWGHFPSKPASPLAARSDRAFTRLARKPDRRALLVGINEYPQEADRLDGCINDVFLVSAVLQELGYRAEEIRAVTDARATAQGIRHRLEWLLDGARGGDQRVFYYSGHGAQIPGYGIGETVDRLDECLVPYDFDWSPEHAVLDDEFYDLYSQLPYATRFTMVLDCCHSGGMTRGCRRVRGLAPPDDVRHRSLRWSREYGMWVPRDFESSNRSLANRPDGENYVGRGGATHRIGRAVALRALSRGKYDRVRKEQGHRGPYLPVILQACREDQLAYEYRHGVTSYGAFTFAMARVLRRRQSRRRPITYRQLVRATTRTLKALDYNQVPCLVGPKAQLTAPLPWQATLARESRR